MVCQLLNNKAVMQSGNHCQAALPQASQRCAVLRPTAATVSNRAQIWSHTKPQRFLNTLGWSGASTRNQKCLASNSPKGACRWKRCRQLDQRMRPQAAAHKQQLTHRVQEATGVISTTLSGLIHSPDGSHEASTKPSSQRHTPLV
jgi:hypothetical protein